MTAPKMYPNPKTVWIRNSVADRIEQRVIVGETATEWLLGNGSIGIPKAQHTIVTPKQLDEALWACEHQFNLANKLRYGRYEPAVLRKVAKLIGYPEVQA